MGFAGAAALVLVSGLVAWVNGEAAAVSYLASFTGFVSFAVVIDYAKFSGLILLGAADSFGTF